MSFYVSTIDNATVDKRVFKEKENLPIVTAIKKYHVFYLRVHWS